MDTELREAHRAWTELLHAVWPTYAALLQEVRSEHDYARQMEWAGARFGLRIFWKLTEELVYAGCNQPFAQDAGLASPTAIVGLTDYDLPWPEQASKFRHDDTEVLQSGASKLGLLENQQNNTHGYSYLDTSKVPLVRDGKTIGVLGAYEILNRATFEHRKQQRAQPE